MRRVQFTKNKLTGADPFLPSDNTSPFVAFSISISSSLPMSFVPSTAPGVGLVTSLDVLISA